MYLLVRRQRSQRSGWEREPGRDVYNGFLLPFGLVQLGGNTYSTAPNWVLRTALGLASLARQSAMRSTGAQHRGVALEGLQGKIRRQHEIGLLGHNEPVHPRHVLLRPVRISSDLRLGLLQVVVILVRPDMHHLVQLPDLTVIPARQLDAVFLPNG